MTRRIVLILIAALFASMLIAEQGADFEAKALDASAKISKKQAEYTALKSSYDTVAKTIDAIKSDKDASWFHKFINSISLKYYLSKGNSLGFKQYAAAKELAELKDDYFTYSMLVIEDNTKQLKDCIKAKCAGLKDLYEKRKKWIKDSGSFGELIKLDLNVEDISAGLSEEAAKDLKEYINKKIVQADERIYMLKEEKEMLEAVKKAGLNVSAEDTAGLNAEIKQLQESRNKLKAMIK